MSEINRTCTMTLPVEFGTLATGMMQSSATVPVERSERRAAIIECIKDLKPCDTIEPQSFADYSKAMFAKIAADLDLTHEELTAEIAFNVGPGQLSFTPRDGSPRVDLGHCSGLSIPQSNTSALIDKSMAEIRARLGAGETITQIYASWGISARTRLNALD